LLFNIIFGLKSDHIGSDLAGSALPVLKRFSDDVHSRTGSPANRLQPELNTAPLLAQL